MPLLLAGLCLTWLVVAVLALPSFLNPRRLRIVFDRQVRSPNECHRSQSNGLKLGWADLSQLAQIEPVHYAKVSLPASGQGPESRKRNRKIRILADRPSQQAGFPSP